MQNGSPVETTCGSPIMASTGKPIALATTARPGMTPNSGAAWDAREGHRCWDESVVDKVLDGADALAMREAGAALIGGYCNVTHGQIRAFRAALLGEAFSK